VLLKETSQIMAKAVDDVGIDYGATCFDGKMDDGTPHLV
jgi:hypothetical protein